MTNNGKQKQQIDQYMKYAGMAFQLLVLMLVAAYAGDYLDKKWGGGKGYFTAALVVLFLVSYLIKMYTDLSKPPE